jgi:hypothetical protein
MATTLVASGRTEPGATNWQQYPGGAGVFVDVDTSSAGFRVGAIYVTSLGGTSSHWATTGGTSIYSPTARSFRVYVRWSDGNPLTPTQANQLGWHINWYAVGA